MKGLSGLEISTSMESPMDHSSTSSISASTLESDVYRSSDEEDELADNDDPADVVLKVEESEVPLTEDIKKSNMSETSEDKGSEVLSKRKRGRPRKNVTSPSTTVSKVAKGRSKTGCVTCRKRKKKCDEAKPSCESASVTKQYWITSTQVQGLTHLRFELSEKCGSLRRIPGQKILGTG